MKVLNNDILDWVWPHLYGKAVPAPNEQLLITATDQKILDELENTIEKRTSQVDERLRNVEAKLMALLTLTSVLSAAVTAAFAVASTMQIERNFPIILVWITIAIVFYMSMMLLRSLWATVNGLMRRGYKQLTCEEIIPNDNEGQIHYEARLLNQRLNHINWNDWVVNQKVNEMAVAHTALRNALAATGAVILIAIATAVLRLLYEARV